MRRAVVALLALGIGCAAPPRTVPTPAAPAPAIGAATAEELRRDLYAFAHDSMHGRETGTEDAARAMRFLVDRLTRLGLEPAGDSGFAQRVPMQKEVFGPETRIAVEEGGVVRSLKIGTEIVPLLNLGAGVVDFDVDGAENYSYFAINAGAKIAYNFSRSVALVLSPQGDIAFSKESELSTSAAWVWPVTAGLRLSF